MHLTGLCTRDASGTPVRWTGSRHRHHRARSSPTRRCACPSNATRSRWRRPATATGTGTSRPTRYYVVAAAARACAVCPPTPRSPIAPTGWTDSRSIPANVREVRASCRRALRRQDGARRHRDPHRPARRDALDPHDRPLLARRVGHADTLGGLGRPTSPRASASTRSCARARTCSTSRRRPRAPSRSNGESAPARARIAGRPIWRRCTDSRPARTTAPTNPGRSSSIPETGRTCARRSRPRSNRATSTPNTASSIRTARFGGCRRRGGCSSIRKASPPRIVGFMLDVTDRHLAEDELRRMEQQLRQAQRLEAMGTLAGGIAHDFNNLLGAILGYGEMALRDAPAGSRLRRDLDNIMIAGERGRALVDRILAFSRSGVGERVAVHVEEVVRETLALFAAKLPRDDRRSTQRLHAGAAAVLGDATQIHQVLMNLRDQRGAGDARRAARCSCRSRPPSVERGARCHDRAARRRRIRAAEGRRHRERHRARDPGEDLRSFLHDQGSRRRDRSRSVARPRHRHRARRRDRRRDHRRPGKRFQRVSAARRRAAPPIASREASGTRDAARRPRAHACRR